MLRRVNIEGKNEINCRVLKSHLISMGAHCDLSHASYLDQLARWVLLDRICSPVCLEQHIIFEVSSPHLGQFQISLIFRQVQVCPTVIELLTGVESLLCQSKARQLRRGERKRWKMRAPVERVFGSFHSAVSSQSKISLIETYQDIPSREIFLPHPPSQTLLSPRCGYPLRIKYPTLHIVLAELGFQSAESHLVLVWRWRTIWEYHDHGVTVHEIPFLPSCAQDFNLVFVKVGFGLSNAF